MEILYEDNHIIAINKSSSDIVQGDKTGDKPLVDTVREYLKERYSKSGNVFCGVVHRLDRPVSGVVLFAKTSKALARLNEMFRGHDMKKEILGNSRKTAPRAGGYPEALSRPQRATKQIVCLHDREKGLQTRRPTLCYDRQIRTLHSARSGFTHRQTSSDTLPAGCCGSRHQRRLEIRCSTLQPRRRYIAARPQCGVRTPRTQRTCRYHRTAADRQTLDRVRQTVKFIRN